MAYLTGNVNIDIRNATMEKIAASPAGIDAWSPVVGAGLGAVGGMLAQRLLPEDERNYRDAAMEGLLAGGLGTLAARGGGVSSGVANSLLGGSLGGLMSLANTPSKTDLSYKMLREMNEMNKLKNDYANDPDVLDSIDAYNNIISQGNDPILARQRVMDKISCYMGGIEKQAALPVNGISRGLGGRAFGRALANGVSNRNGLVFKRLGYSMPDGSGLIGGSPFLVKGLNKPFLLDAPITKRIQPVNRMFDADNIINWNIGF